MLVVLGFKFMNIFGFSIFVGMRSFNFCCLKFSGFLTFMDFQFLDMRSFNSSCLKFSGFLVFGLFGHEEFQFLLFELFWVSSFWT